MGVVVWGGEREVAGIAEGLAGGRWGGVRFNECAPCGAPVVASLRVPSATKSDPLNLYPVNPVCGQPTEIEPYFSVGNCQMGFYN